MAMPLGDGFGRLDRLDEDTYRELRRQMVAEQLGTVRDERVLAAMSVVPRHLFVPAEIRWAAYEDRPLPIGFGQTISQPYIVAFMTQALQLPATRPVVVLEVSSMFVLECLNA